MELFNPKERLEDIIKIVGEDLLNLPDLHHTNLIRLRQGIEGSLDMKVYPSISKSLKNMYEIYQNYQTEIHGDLALASRMFDYNLRGIMNVISNGVYGNHEFKKNREQKANNRSLRQDYFALGEDSIQSFFDHLALFRIFGLSMAYLASGGENEKFLVNIPYHDVKLLLDRFKPQTVCHDDKRKVMMNFPGYDGVEYRPLQRQVEGCNTKELSFSLPRNGYIMNPEFIALWEIVKNAVDFETSPRIEIKDHKIQWNTVNYFKVIDNGSGILDETGNPLDYKRLPEIFGDFSTKNGGLGLQLAQRLINLRKGKISVETSWNGIDSFSYSPNLHGGGVYHRSDEDSRRGTSFMFSVINKASE